MTEQTWPVDPTVTPTEAVAGNAAVGSAIVVAAPTEEAGEPAPTNLEVERGPDGPGGPVVEEPLPPLDPDAPHAPVPDTSDEGLAEPTLVALGESPADEPG